MVAWGAGLGVLILGVDEWLKRSGSTFRAHLMPIAVGIYLPFGLAPPILLGGLLAWWWTRDAREPAEAERRVHRGILFSSGVIAGEALTAVAIAGVAAAGWRTLEELLLDPDARAAGESLFAPATVTWASIAACAVVAFAFFRATRPR